MLLHDLHNVETIQLRKTRDQPNSTLANTRSAQQHTGKTYLTVHLMLYYSKYIQFTRKWWRFKVRKNHPSIEFGYTVISGKMSDALCVSNVVSNEANMNQFDVHISLFYMFVWVIFGKLYELVVTFKFVFIVKFSYCQWVLIVTYVYAWTHSVHKPRTALNIVCIFRGLFTYMCADLMRNIVQAF